MIERPDPDQLLARVQEEEARAARGKLKIFFGASAGVGKTYAMLSIAHQLATHGTQVLVGIVETHGRSETEALLAGLECLPRKAISYRERILQEFDLDAALARHPQLILVDELAHSNAPGSRHPKRWQDIDELLAAGIDVYTTVNVQHLETLNDVVSGITGIRVWETVPEKVFDSADEVVLVDLPPDELLQRLKEGKVYLPQQAERAINNFFRKGNLIALRELALRRTADRVDVEMQQYRRDRSVAQVWQTRDSVLACIGPGTGSEKILRSAARIASRLEVPWHAIYIETPALQHLNDKRRHAILRALHQAQEMGALTASLSGNDAVEVSVRYAREHNLSKVLVGRDHPRVWRFWHRSFADRIGRAAPDLDVTQVAREEPRQSTASQVAEKLTEHFNTPWMDYAKSAAVCVLAAAIAAPLHSVFELANIVMIFLLAEVVVAMRYGRGPAVLAAFLSVALFDVLYVPPRFSFAVSDVQYLMTFAVMLAVGLVIGQLMARFKYQAQVSALRENRVRALYEMSRELSAALLPEQIAETCERFAAAQFGSRSAILLADDAGNLRQPVGGKPELAPDRDVAQWAYDHASSAGLGTDTLPASPILYLPLQAPMRVRGVLALEPENAERLMSPEQRRLLETFARLTAIALERIHYVEVAQDTTLHMESERLRNSLLSAISHDLRTPLTALVGLADSLKLLQPPPSAQQDEIASAIREQSLRLRSLVENLLDMARLQAGKVQLNRQWVALEEVVGSALKALEQPLASHPVKVDLPDELPLVELDAVMIERVLCNLLENACKYTPTGTPLRISAHAVGDTVEVSLSDSGPGLPPGKEDAIFIKFERGQKESATPGVGLGLAICRAIVEAHGGSIRAENRHEGGARFIFTLPRGTPPQLPEEPAA